MSAQGKKGGWRRKVVIAAVGLFGIGACAYGGVHLASEKELARTVVVDAPALKVPNDDDAAIQRGRYLVDHLLGCKECHGSDMGGKMVMDNGAMGRWYAPNVTSGKGSRVTEWTGKEWALTLRHGVAPDGRRQWLMPSEDYGSLGDEDLGAVVAYVRSLPPVDREAHPIELGPVARLLLATGELTFAYDRIDHKAARPEAKPGGSKEWGSVLIGSCTGCHGPGLSGGKIPGGDPDWPEARNITPDKATGIGSWSYGDFEKSMREGRRPDGTAVRDPMPWKAYAGLKDEDIEALWEHIKGVPPKSQGGR